MNATLETPEKPAVTDRSEQAIGQIAVDLPGATAVFRRLKLDFCCGGQIGLRQAAADKGIALEPLLAELGELELHRRTSLPASMAPAPLIDLIVSRFHEVHRQQLPELLRMARRVEAVHRDHPQVPKGLADLLENMQTELLDHMQKEELVLFPLLKSGNMGYAQAPIHMMRGEHTEHGLQVERLAALTNDATPPAGACNTWRALYAGIAQFTDDLIQHIHLENNVLFPAFETQPAGSCCGSCGCA